MALHRRSLFGLASGALAGGAAGAALPPGVAAPPSPMLEEPRGFYFDLTSAMTRYAMPSVLAFAKPTHILTGFDFPHAGLNGIPASRAFDALPLSDRVRGAIMRDNGLLISDRFAAKPMRARPL